MWMAIHISYEVDLLPNPACRLDVPKLFPAQLGLKYLRSPKAGKVTPPSGQAWKSSSGVSSVPGPAPAHFSAQPASLTGETL